ncbi:MAG: hypothetical protein JRC53_04470, partial [Deltaproteobacteria bacterium]|nr:hypothetical protein [Deltaproteobacteria bacterium]
MAAAAPFILPGILAIGAIKQGETQNKIASYNAAVTAQDGIAATKKAEFHETAHRERVRRALSRQRALVGVSGVETSGSALMGLEESAKQGELDALSIRF